MIHWIGLRECRLGLFRAQINRQIPRSFAANAFNLMTDALFRSEVIRLCTFWDRASEDRESIPTILALIAGKAERRVLADEAYRVYADMEPSFLGNPDAETLKLMQQVANEDHKRMACENLRSFVSDMRIARTKAAEVLVGNELSGLKALRNNHFAHSLKPGKNASDAMKEARYGHEGIVFEATLEIVDRLHRAINQTSFEFSDSREMAVRDADELWSNCQFSIGTGRRLPA
jgi:AbiU2